MKTICFTGPRPKRENNYQIPNRDLIFERLKDAINRAYTAGFKKFIFGGAIGIDQLAMQAAVSETTSLTDIELVCAKPFPSQHVIWPKHVQDEFFVLLSYMTVINISPDPYSVEKMDIRNRYMVDNSDVVIAIWDSYSKGGTKNCIDYAIKQGKSVLIIDPETLEEKWIIP